MTALLLAAFSVSDKVKTIGALAGFAAILGLAVLSLLYFAQAREVKRLREWAGRAPERAVEAALGARPLAAPGACAPGRYRPGGRTGPRRPSPARAPRLARHASEPCS